MITETDRLALLQWLRETEDEEAISKVQKIRNNSRFLNSESNRVLDTRIQRFNSCETKFSSWEEVKSRIQAAS